MARSANNPSAKLPALKVAPSNVDEAAFEQAMLERWPRLGASGIILRLATTALVFFSTWRAIHYFGATALSLLLPMAAELLVAVATGLLLAVFVVRDGDFRRQVWKGMRTWIIVAVAFLVWQYYQSTINGRSFGVQLSQVWLATRAFLLNSGFLQAMVMAALGFCAGVVNDVGAYRRNGPPFVYLTSLNFGLRTFLMFVFGWVLFLMTVFIVDFNRRKIAEAMWLALLLTELLALWLPTVVQNKIRAARAENPRRDSMRQASA